MGNPLSWSLADRCMTAAIIVLVASGLFTVAVWVGGGTPFVPVDTDAAPLVRWIALIHLQPWWLILVLAVRARRPGRAASPWLAIATVYLFAVTLALFTLVTGPFAAPGWIAFLGGSIVGYLLFERRHARLGVVAYLALVMTGAALVHERPWAWIDQIVPRDTRMPSTTTLLGQAITSTGLFVLVLALIAFIIDRWRDREARYQKLARTDWLTGLTNRRKLMEIGAREVARARRYGAPLAVVLIDLDHFKKVNDTHGHIAGDRVLARAAAVFAAAIRDVDTVARFGGEEFAILLPDTDARGALEVAERCARKLAAAPLDVGAAEPLVVTASMGVADTAGPSADLEDLLRRADDAMYRAKQGGRNRIVEAPRADAGPMPAPAAPAEPAEPGAQTATAPATGA